MSIKIPICLLMDVADFMGTLRTAAGSSTELVQAQAQEFALFADMAVQRLIQVPTVLYRCIRCQLSCLLSTHLRKEGHRLCACLP